MQASLGHDLKYRLCISTQEHGRSGEQAGSGHTGATTPPILDYLTRSIRSSSNGQRGDGRGKQAEQVAEATAQRGGRRRKGRSQTSSKDWKNQQWGNWKDDSNQELKNLVSMLTNLVIRQEDQLNINRQDTAFVLFVRTDVQGTAKIHKPMPGKTAIPAKEAQKMYHGIYAHGDTPLPWHTAIGSGISSSINYNDVRDWAANSGGCQNVAIPGHAVPQCGMDSFRMLPRARTPAKIGFGQQDQPSRAEAARCQPVHQLRLHNPSNHCYATAVVLGFMWACRTNDTQVIVFKVLHFKTLKSYCGNYLNGRPLYGSGEGPIYSMMHVNSYNICMADGRFAKLMPWRMGGQNSCVWDNTSI